jgi:hypothetical protein
VLLHPAARLSALDGSALAARLDATVERMSVAAPRLRVVDTEGAPVSGLPVEVAVENLRLGPTELLAPLTAGLQPLFYRTDADGEIELRGIDPLAPTPPRVLLPRADGAVAVSWAGWNPGRIQQVVIDRAR